MKLLILLLPILGALSFVASSDSEDAVQVDGGVAAFAVDETGLEHDPSRLRRSPDGSRVIIRNRPPPRRRHPVYRSQRATIPNTGGRRVPRPQTLPPIQTQKGPQVGRTRFSRSPEPFRAPPPRRGGGYKLPPGVNPTFPKF